MCSKQSRDLTTDKYNVRLTATINSSGQIRFKRPSNLFAFDTIALICLTHERVLVTSRVLTLRL